MNCNHALAKAAVWSGVTLSFALSCPFAHAANLEFLSDLTTIPKPVDRYCVDLTVSRNQNKIEKYSLEVTLGNVPFTGRGGPSIEAGKPFIIRYHRGFLAPTEHESLEKVVLWYKIDDGEVETRLIGEGFRDAFSGELILTPFQINVPFAARGNIKYWFQLMTSSGNVKWDKSEGDPYWAEIVPTSQSILKFDQNWHQSQNQKLVSGEAVKIAFDITRIKRQLGYLFRNDIPVWNAVAMVSIDGQSAKEFALTAESHDIRGVPVDVAILMPALKLPVGARSIKVWFVGHDYMGTVFDSNFGGDFTFAVQ